MILNIAYGIEQYNGFAQNFVGFSTYTTITVSKIGLKI